MDELEVATELVAFGLEGPNAARAPRLLHQAATLAYQGQAIGKAQGAGGGQGGILAPPVAGHDVGSQTAGGAQVIEAPDDAGKKPATEGRVAFVSMDFDGNGRVNITDVQGMIDWLYLGGTPASCPPAMDYDANGQVNVTDLLGLMEWLYLGGQSPFYPHTVYVKGCQAP